MAQHGLRGRRGRLVRQVVLAEPPSAIERQRRRCDERRQVEQNLQRLLLSTDEGVQLYSPAQLAHLAALPPLPASLCRAPLT